ncbi:MAG TPA: T9SS type A sorting domain-containing protein [Candidatus Eisenbacteria bacterium]|nr:T9SS type A sorting domain-containing protein [Candidatus Eisenbacteria bacterium]
MTPLPSISLPESLPPPPASEPTQMPSDPSAIYSVPSIPRPAYMAPFVDPTFGRQVVRIAGDVGSPTAPVSGTWGSDARHTYSKQQPWNSDGTLLMIDNRKGGSPSKLILNGATYRPLQAPCSGDPRYDFRWHPGLAHPHEVINVDKSGSELMWWDVTTCTKTRSWTLPIKADYGIGSGEGNPSNDGRFVAVGNQNAMVVIDMDPQPPFAPWPSQRIGPVYTFEACSLSAGCPIGNLSVSASGKYVDVKYANAGDAVAADLHRIFEIDPETLELRPHAMAAGSERCDEFAGRPNGYIFPLKHADLAMNPFDGNQDVIIGGRACPGSSIGKVVMVRLSDGKVTPLTDSGNEAAVQHVSTRNLDRPGWAYVGYYKQDGKRFSDEIVAVKMDGSRTVERIAHKHSRSSGCYRCESHPVPSRDGRRVIFASNWAEDCGGDCGDPADIKDYVVGAMMDGVGAGSEEAVSGGGGGGAAEAGDAPKPVISGPALQLALEGISPNPTVSVARVSYALRSAAPATLELVDLAGRRVMSRALPAPAAGRGETTIQRGQGSGAGVYWLRLTQAGESVTSKVVFMR